MNSKRKADLQRKLTLAPVPRPPVGLAERIKNDIPEYLRPDADRRRMSRALSFNLRVAASLLLLLSSVVATIYLLEPEEQMKQIAAVNRQGPTQVFAERETAAAAGRATDEVQVEITETASAPAAAAAPAALHYADTPPPPATPAAGRREEAAQLADRPLGGGMTDTASTVESASVAALRVAPPPPPPAIVAAAPPPEPIPVPAETAANTELHAAPAPPAPRTAAQSFVREAHAADMNFGPRTSVFGISVDASVFHNLKQTLESNQRPSASAVNLEAIVNYFAGAPSKPPRSGVKLEVEGSPSPVGGIGQRGFVRFSIDTPLRASNVPVAADAKLEVDFNGKVVEQATPIGDAAITGAESALLHNLSVTGLYEVSLRSNLRPSDRVATVKLSYTGVVDGKRRTIERAVYARDFTKLWTRASRRHRLASLGAVWGQSLKVAAPAAPEVARRATELATQNPADERAQELATAASASSKLPNSSGF